MSKCTKCGLEAMLWSVNASKVDGLPPWAKKLDTAGVSVCFPCLPADIRARVEQERKSKER